MAKVAYAFIAGSIGVLAFHLLHLPLPWLLGPIFSCLSAALIGVPLGGITTVNHSMRTILGVAVGASLTPTVVASFPEMFPTLLLIPIMTLMIGFVGLPYFQKICGYDFPTAYYSAMPGGLQDMIAFGEEAGANVRTLGLIHASRVTIIVVALPFILQEVWKVDLSNPPGKAASNIPMMELVIMGFCAIAGWQIAKFVGLFGASILGPLIIAAIAALFGLIENRPPAEAIWAAQFFIGMTVGAKYSGITLQEIRHDLLAGVGYCGLLIGITLLFLQVNYMLQLAPGLETLLAFSPGGQAELTVLALIVGADIAFVIAHHILRIFIVILGAPIIAKYLEK